LPGGLITEFDPKQNQSQVQISIVNCANVISRASAKINLMA